MTSELERATDAQVSDQDIQLVLDNKEQLAKQPALLLVEILITLFLNNTYSTTGY